MSSSDPLPGQIPAETSASLPSQSEPAPVEKKSSRFRCKKCRCVRRDSGLQRSLIARLALQNPDFYVKRTYTSFFGPMHFALSEPARVARSVGTRWTIGLPKVQSEAGELELGGRNVQLW